MQCQYRSTGVTRNRKRVDNLRYARSGTTYFLQDKLRYYRSQDIPKMHFYM
jgi:hypothetical protein